PILKSFIEVVRQPHSKRIERVFKNLAHSILPFGANPQVRDCDLTIARSACSLRPNRGSQSALNGCGRYQYVSSFTRAIGPERLNDSALERPDDVFSMMLATDLRCRASTPLGPRLH